MALDATAKGTGANSYVTQAEATTYFTLRLNMAEWTAAVTASTADPALVMATNRLEAEDYEGFKTTIAQRLKWPRADLVDDNGDAYDVDVIPRPVKEATFELALALLKDDVLLDSGLEEFERVRIGPIDVSPFRGRKADALPAIVVRLLEDLRIGGSGITRPAVRG